MAPEILTEIFSQKESNCCLRNCTTLQGRSIKTGIYCSETISSLGPNMGHFTGVIRKHCLSNTIQKENS